MIIDKRKQLVISERTIRCRRTGVKITNRIEINEETAPSCVEYITMETPAPTLRDARAVLRVVE